MADSPIPQICHEDVTVHPGFYLRRTEQIRFHAYCNHLTERERERESPAGLGLASIPSALEWGRSEEPEFNVCPIVTAWHLGRALGRTCHG